MNNNFLKKINAKRNAFLSALISFIVDVIVYGIKFGVEYFMGKVLDEWLSNNPNFVHSLIGWVINNPVGFTFIVFFISLLILYLYDYRKYTTSEKQVNLPAEDKTEEKKQFEASRIKVAVLQGFDETQKDFSIKQVRLISQTSDKLLNCICTATKFSKLNDGQEESVSLNSDELVWSKGISGVMNNRVDLIEGKPFNLYVARNFKKKKLVEIIGANDLNTPIVEKGKYRIDIRLDGDNFEPHTFSVYFGYDGKKKIEIEKVTRLSKIMFFYTQSSKNALNT